jgi:hypothetical protein
VALPGHDGAALASGPGQPSFVASRRLEVGGAALVLVLAVLGAVLLLTRGRGRRDGEG